MSLIGLRAKQIIQDESWVPKEGYVIKAIMFDEELFKNTKEDLKIEKDLNKNSR